MDSKGTPEEERERLRQKELKNNPLSSLNEGLNRAENGNLTDLSGGMGWKGTGILILVLVVGFILYSYFF
ncbi:DUF6366 family protein [Metabacillus fastidiosus]|uniref:DUF6366 family protein n=1 Tax=Metabacillus fastidiosus TaxID=1458 RepID=A0ABU6P4U7_9BACI|nr:DUF6366 family protein [Metabacillus fastidiosus]